MSTTTPGALDSAQLTDHALALDVPERVARAYAEAKARLDGWRQAVADIEAHLAAVMDGHGLKRLELPGVGMLEAKPAGVKRTGWRHDELLGDIARAVPNHRRLVESTGELEPSEWVAVRLVQECVSLGAGKAPIRKLLHRSLDEYCEESTGDPKVTLTLFDRAAG